MARQDAGSEAESRGETGTGGTAPKGGSLPSWLVRLASLHLTLVVLALLMGLVLICTLAQVHLGTHGAVEATMRRFVVWYHAEGSSWRIPVFPGGALVGLVLLLNLTAALVVKVKLTWKKAGLWLVHLGLVVLVGGEFVSGALQEESRMTIQEGETVAFLEHYRDLEVAVSDQTDARHDEVWGIGQQRLKKGGDVSLPGSPLTLRIKGFLPNAELRKREASEVPAVATAGLGVGIVAVPRPVSNAEERPNTPVAYVEPLAGGQSQGVWMLSPVLGAPQAFTHEGRTYALALRPKRFNLPYSLTLKKFSHDRYPGTDIPKNFSSLVHLSDPAKRESRDVLISMNQPLRYDGKAFYQASYQGDTITVLQVVENPGWLLPYISTVLVTLGLLVHFGVMLAKAMGRKQEA